MCSAHRLDLHTERASLSPGAPARAPSAALAQCGGTAGDSPVGTPSNGCQPEERAMPTCTLEVCRSCSEKERKKEIE